MRPSPTVTPPVKIQLTRTGLTWALSVSHWSRRALVSEFLALALLVAGYSTPYWEFIDDNYGTFYSGLWRVCLYSTYCGWFGNHAMYSWFRAVQVVISLSLLLLLVSLGITVTHIIIPALDRKRRLLSLAATVSLATTLLLCVTGVAIYGAYQGYPNPTDLAWSYWCVTASNFFTLLALVCLIFEVGRLSTTPADEKPILNHSVSVDPTAPVYKASPKEHEVFAAAEVPHSVGSRDRSSSLVRMRVNSCSALMSPPIMEYPENATEPPPSVFNFPSQ